MKPGIPWSIKGIESETREAAKSAARRSGMTLGQWLNDKIQQEAGSDERSSLSKAAATSKSKKKPSKKPRKKSHKRSSKKVAEFDARLAELADQLSAMAEQGQSTAVNRFVDYDDEPGANRAIEAMITRIENGEQQTREAFQAVHTRLDAIDEKLEVPAADETPAQSPEFQALETALRNIVEHIETSEKRNRDALNNMQERMSEMTRKAETAQVSAINQSAPAIAALESRVAELAAQNEQAVNLQKDQTQSYLEERLAGISEQIDAVRHSSDSMTKRAELTAVDAAKKEAREVEQRVANLIGEARTLMVKSATPGDALKTIRSEIESLNQRFDDIKAESASDQDVQSLKLAIEQLTSSVSAGPDMRPIAAMEKRLADLTRRLDETPATDHLAPQFAELEQRIVGLDQQLATAMDQQGDAQAFAALESQISTVADRLSATEDKLGALTTIEQSISQLYAAVEDGKSETKEIAKAAALEAAENIRQSEIATQPVVTGPSPELVALEEGLAAVRQSAQSAEKHNQETLEAVHETLEQIITKLADMESCEAAAPATPAAATPLATDTPLPGQDQTGTADWQAAVQSHLQENLATSLPEQAAPEAVGLSGEAVADVSPAFNPQTFANEAQPQVSPTQDATNLQSTDEQQINKGVDLFNDATAQAAAEGQSAFEQMSETVSEPVAAAAPEESQAPLDYIAQARLASQSAAPQAATVSPKGVGFLTDKIMPGKQDNATGDGDKKSKSFFSLPFLAKKKVTADNDDAIAKADSGNNSKASRTRLILAGLALLIAAGTFAFSQAGKNSTTTPASTASVPEKVAPAPEKSATPPVAKKTSQNLSQTSDANRLVKQVSLTIPQKNGNRRPLTAAQTGMPSPQSLNSGNQTDPVLSAPTDPVTTASLPPAPSPTHSSHPVGNIQSPLNIQSGSNQAKTPVAQQTAPATSKPPMSASTTPPTQQMSANLPPEGAGTLELRKAAANGDAAAQFVIASRYAEGRKLKRDYAKAAEWYQKAASSGLAPAQYRLGTLFERGNGVPKDVNAARLWYQRAAESGNVKAMHNLAVIYASASSGKADFAKAQKWFEKASAHGLKDSQYNLAVIHERGLTGKHSQKDAYFWYSLAAAAGDRDAAVKAHSLKNYLSAADVKALDQKRAAWKPQRANKLGNFVAIKDPKWQVVAQKRKTPVLGVKPNLKGKALVLQSQTLLTKLGFDIGAADGVMGSRTANAVRLFQLQNGLPVNGMVTNDLLQQLQART